MPNFYQLEEEQKKLADLVLESGEITDEQHAILAGWIEDAENALGKKIDKCLNLAEESYGIDEIGKREAARTAKRRKAATGLGDRLYDILLAYFERNIITGKISTPQGRRVGVENCAPSLEIDQSQVPVEYIVTELVVSVDKDKIREDLKAGKTIPGCKFVGGKRLAVR